MTADLKEEKSGSENQFSLTEKGRRFVREDRFLENLSERERKAYEECMAMLQGISEEGLLEEACDWLERMIRRKEDTPDPQSS
jgi:pentatricopeptide repeat protein